MELGGNRRDVKGWKEMGKAEGMGNDGKGRDGMGREGMGRNGKELKRIKRELEWLVGIEEDWKGR